MHASVKRRRQKRAHKAKTRSNSITNVQTDDSTATKSAGAKEEEDTKADLDREVERGDRPTVVVAGHGKASLRPRAQGSSPTPTLGAAS